VQTCATVLSELVMVFLKFFVPILPWHMSTHHVCRLHEISAFAQNLALKNFALGINTTANTTAMVGLFYSASFFIAQLMPTYNNQHLVTACGMTERFWVL